MNVMYNEPTGIRTNVQRRRSPIELIGVSLFAVILILVSTRFVISYHESYVIIRAERRADIDLVDLCASGAARESPKMRVACLDAQSDGAAPIYLKAFIRTVSGTAHELTSYFGWPFKVTGVFILIALLLTPLRALSEVIRGSRTEASAAHHTIYVVNGDEHCNIEDMTPDQPRRFDRIRQRIATRTPTMLQLPWSGDDEELQRQKKWL